MTKSITENNALQADRLRRSTAQSLLKDWNDLCDRFLPIAAEKSIWRASRAGVADDLEQGWKLHLSATILSANEVFRRVAPYLAEKGILFKAPASLHELRMLNCGLFYGFSQIGKVITVYPKSTAEAVSLARRLDRMTRDLPGPAIPYDLPFRQQGRVYYRYGAFANMEIEDPEGTRIPALRNPEGQLVPDMREPGKAVPSWAADPFPKYKRRKNAAENLTENPLLFIKAIEALSQRGKGGVYRAIDLQATPARWCLLKEGRRHGETDWEGRDGHWRIRHEAEVLNSLTAQSVAVPEVYQSFELGENSYVVTEFIEGENLHVLLTSRRKRLHLAKSLAYGIQLVELLDRIHSAGWVWRDCKPLNLMVTPRGELRPLDFEGACRIDATDRMPWGTTGYVLPERLEKPFAGSRVSDDLFALGATLHQLITGRIPDATYPPPPVSELRRGVPPTVREVITALLNPDLRLQPQPGKVKRVLQSACRELGHTSVKPERRDRKSAISAWA